MNLFRTILAALRARLPRPWVEPLPEDAVWPTLHDYPYTS
jgi:hypothetical protein